jgi:hypothetical protein
MSGPLGGPGRLDHTCFGLIQRHQGGAQRRGAPLQMDPGFAFAWQENLRGVLLEVDIVENCFELTVPGLGAEVFGNQVIDIEVVHLRRQFTKLIT